MEKKQITSIFGGGVKTPVKLFEKKQTPIKITFNDLNYNPYEHQGNFNYNDKTYNSVIPLKIFQTWGTKDLLRKVTQGYIAGNSPKPHPINPTAIA